MNNSNIISDNNLTSNTTSQTSADSNVSPQTTKEPIDQQSATMSINNNNNNNNKNNSQQQHQQQTNELQSPAGDDVASQQLSTGMDMRPQSDNQSSVTAFNQNTGVTLNQLQQQQQHQQQQQQQQQQQSYINNNNQQMNLQNSMTPTSAGPYQQQQLQQPPPPPTHPVHQPLLADESKSDIALDIVPSSAQTSQDKQQQPQTTQKSVITKVKLSDELNIFDWFRTKDIINQIAEKAKSSVDSVITTLDPGMKEYLYSGGNVNIVVISDSTRLVSPIRDAFQSVFGRATVVGARYNPPATIIDYPIRIAKGFQESVMVAQEKIKKFRQDTSSVPQNQVVIVVQAALVCIDGTSDSSDKQITASTATATTTTVQDDNLQSKWFLTYCMLIEDPVLCLTVKSYSQMVPMDEIVMEAVKTSRFPDTFQDKHLGYSLSIDELMAAKCRLSLEELAGDENGCLWLPKWAGLYETQVIHELSLSLANAYRRRWSECASIETVS